jgi:DNA-binding MarR family transcriptional regulator
VETAEPEGEGAVEGFVPDYLLYLLAAASAAASGVFHAEVRRVGLRPVEWRVLACLSDIDGQTIGALSAFTMFEATRLTRIVDQMAAAGYVRRATDAGDRRLRRVWLTGAGRATATALVEAARAHEAALMVALGEDEARRLKALLRRLAEVAPSVRPPFRPNAPGASALSAEQGGDVADGG